MGWIFQLLEPYLNLTARKTWCFVNKFSKVCNQVHTISKARDFHGEMLYADLQCELLGNLPNSSARAIENLNQLLTAFPTYNGPHRLLRPAQSSIATVHAQATALADSLMAQKHQCRITAAVIKEVAAKHEAVRQNEREGRARSQRQRDHGQTTMTSHIMRGAVNKPPPPPTKAPMPSTSRSGSALAASPGFWSSPPTWVQKTSNRKLSQSVIALT